MFGKLYWKPCCSPIQKSCFFFVKLLNNNRGRSSLAKGQLNVKLRERSISISFVASKSYSLKCSQAVRQGHVLVFPLSISQSLPLFGLSLFIRSVSGRESPFGLSHTEQRPPTKTEECSKRLWAFISNKTWQEKRINRKPTHTRTKRKQQNKKISLLLRPGRPGEVCLTADTSCQTNQSYFSNTHLW